MIIFSPSGHCMCVCRCRWGRRFRLPTLYVHAQTAPALASGYFRRDLSFCHLAAGWVHAEKSVHPEVGRRKRLPHGWAGVCCGGSRNGQGCVWTSMAQGYPGGASGCRRAPPWREREVFLSASGVGNHAQSRPRAVASEDGSVHDHALGEGFYCATSQSNPESHGRAILAG